MKISRINKFTQSKSWLVGLVLASLVGGFLAYRFLRPQEQHQDLSALTVTVKTTDLRVRVSASGTIVSLENVNLSPKTAGRLTQLFVDQGDRVQKGQILARFTSAQLEALGVRTLFVVARPGDARRGIRQNTLVLADAEAIATQAPSVKEVAPQIKEPELMSYRSKAVQAMVVGTTPAFVFVQNYSVTQGHFFTLQDEKRNARVVVLGSQLAQELFGDWPAVGETMRLNNLSFRVIGVMGAKGTAAGNNQDEVAVIPVTTMANRLVGRTSPYGIGLQFISVLPRDDAASMEAAEFQITNLLRRRHQITGSSVDDFVVRNQKDALAVFSNVSGALTILLATRAARLDPIVALKSI